MPIVKIEYLMDKRRDSGYWTVTAYHNQFSCSVRFVTKPTQRDLRRVRKHVIEQVYFHEYWMDF